MAFPTVANRTGAATTTAATTLVVPFTQTTGDFVIIFIANDTTTISTLSDGFSQITDNTGATRIIYKSSLAGTEGGDCTITFSGSCKACATSYNIQGASTTDTPQFSTVTTGTSTSPDPGSLSPTGGAKDYLWFAFAGLGGEDAAAPISSAPTDFTNLTTRSTGTAGAVATNSSLGTAERQLNASSLDPGAFTLSTTRDWRAYTVAVHPAPASGPTNLKSLDTNIKSNIKSYNTNLIANVKSINTNS